MWRTLRIVLLLLGGVATVPAAAQGDVELPTDLAAMPLAPAELPDGG